MENPKTMIPSTGIPKRIGAIYGRRPTSQWSEKEIKAYRKLAKAGCFDSLDDLELIELYYVTEKRKGDKGIHRRDLLTFLNNYQGELDRARAWREKVKRKPKGYGDFNGHRQLGTATDEDFRNAHEIAKREIETLRAQLRPVPGAG